MATKREEMKALRLQAMGVVGGQMDASAEMFRRVIDAGDAVTKARERAEAAHMGALDEQVGDLNEMAEDMAEFAQAVPTSGGQTGTRPLNTSTKPAAPTSKPSTSSAALASLMAAQPNPPAANHSVTVGETGNVGEVLSEDGNAYHGTAPPKL